MNVRVAGEIKWRRFSCQFFLASSSTSSDDLERRLNRLLFMFVMNIS